MIEVLTVVALALGIVGVVLDIIILVRQDENSKVDQLHWENQEKLDRIILAMEARELFDLEAQ